MPGSLAHHDSDPPRPSGRIIAFPLERVRASRDDPASDPTSSSPTDLRRYERSGPDDDYRHRMTVNVFAAVVCVSLVAAGIWLADAMADLRQTQDCVLAGHRNCAKIPASRSLR